MKPANTQAIDISGPVSRVLTNIEKVLVGKRQQVMLALVAYLAEGHILLEDVPGVAKTMLARAMARSVGGSFKRVQCTPDLLPTDITGVSVFSPKTAEFEFRPGPIFCHTLLADEINRATPRTQAALLEAMAERKVTVDGQTYALKPPFLVIATQNPVDHEGTFPLPEAQLDRFLVRLSLGYPSLEDEFRLLGRLRKSHPIEDLQPVLSVADWLALQEATKDVHVDDKVKRYILEIVHATREHEDIALGGQPPRLPSPAPHRPGRRRRPGPRLRHPRRCQAHGAAGPRAPRHPPAREPPPQTDRRRAAARAGLRGAGSLRPRPGGPRRFR